MLEFGHIDKSVMVSVYLIELLLYGIVNLIGGFIMRIDACRHHGNMAAAHKVVRWFTGWVAISVLWIRVLINNNAQASRGNITLADKRNIHITVRKSRRACTT